METKIILTPKQVTELTGIDLLKCVQIAFPDQRGLGEKEAEKLKNCTFELTEFIQFPMKQSIIVEDGQCILRAVIHSVNANFQNFLSRVVMDKTSILNIEVSAKFKSYLPILTPENRTKLYKLLADRHSLTYGQNTREYKQYQLISSN